MLLRQRLSRFVLWSVVLGVVIGVGATGARAQSKPNIIFYMADDLGYGELGVTGQLARAASNPSLPVLQTPHIDALAAGGMMFNNAYATPICGSTRGSLTTGFHNGHSVIDSNGLNNNGGNQFRDIDYGMGEALKTVNYTSGAYGKWGAGMDGRQLSPSATNDNGLINHPNPQVTHVGSTPIDKGFDEFYGYLNHIHAHNYYIEYLWQHDTDGSEADPRNMEVDWSPTPASYSADLIADKSLEFITNHAGGSDPFYVYAGTTLPHSDFNPPQDALWQSYINAGYTTAQANYAAMVNRMDQHVGDIVDHLKDPNRDGNEDDSVYDNTLIIFMSDNGGTGAQMDLFDARAGLRGDKGDVTEGGIKSPFIAHWNGTIAPGTTSDEIVGLVDMFATFAELGGADVPVGLDSASIVDAFSGGTLDKKKYHVFEARVKDDWAIRMGQWKLLKEGSNQLRLYDLNADQDESNNLLSSPTAEQQAIADFLEQIALDEGVESDAGTGGAQNTFIVQYKDWAPVGGSTDWADNTNWSGGSQFNPRGTAAENFSSGPANNWIGTVDNTAGGSLETVVINNSEVLGLEVKGTAGDMTVKINQGKTLKVRNGARISAGGEIELDGGFLNTVRDIDIRAGGTLSGRGDIRPIYEHTIASLDDLEIDVTNAGTLNVGLEQSNGGGGNGGLSELLGNTGWETGNALGDGDIDLSYAEIDNWTGDVTDFTMDAAIDGNAQAGTYRAVLGLRTDGQNQNQVQQTSHTIALGDEFDLSVFVRGFSGWDTGIDTVDVELFYNNGTEQTLATVSMPVTSAWVEQNIAFSPIADANAVGQQLWVRFQPIDGNGSNQNEFASLDTVSLMLAADLPTPLNILTIAGHYEQTADGVMEIDVFGSGGVAGEDFDRLNVTRNAALAGGLALTQATEMTLGDSAVVIEADALTGEFDNALITGTELTAVANTRVAVLYEDSGTDGNADLDQVRVMATYQGDNNGDGAVGPADLTALKLAWLATDATWQDGDYNYDGNVGPADLTALKLNWLNDLGLAGQPTPEPTSLVLLAMGGVALMRRRRG